MALAFSSQDAISATWSGAIVVAFIIILLVIVFWVNSWVVGLIYVAVIIGLMFYSRWWGAHGAAGLAIAAVLFLAALAYLKYIDD
jgi:hypothetical protein